MFATGYKMASVTSCRTLTVLVMFTQLCGLNAAPQNATCTVMQVTPIASGQRLTITGCSSAPLDSQISDILEGNDNIVDVIVTNSKLKKMPRLLCDSSVQMLDLSHNFLTDFPACIYTMTHLRVLDLSYNYINLVQGQDVQELEHLETVYLQYNFITNVDYGAWAAFNTSQVKTIHLNHNQIKYLPHDVIRLRFQYLQRIDISYNNFICDCEDKWMIPWLENFQNKLLNKYEIMCSNSATGGPFPLLKITDMKKFVCDPRPLKSSKYDTELTDILISFLVIIVVLPFIVGSVCYAIWKKRRWIFHKTRWHPFDVDECGKDEKQYDVFISCAHQDEEWCTKHVIEFLEDKHYKVCWHREHFRPGEPVMNSVGRCIDESKRTLCILSKSYTESPLCMRELETAIAQDFENNKHRTVIIKFQDVNTSQFEPHVERFLKTITYIERGSKRFYDNLMYALPIKSMDGLIRDFDIVVREDIPLEECTGN